MQYKDKKTLKLRKIIGETFREIRENKTDLSCNKLENEFEIGAGVLNRIENGKTDCKIITAWRIAESLGMRLSEIIKIIEDKTQNFFLTDE